MRGLLVAAEIDKGIRISDDALPCVLEQRLELRNVLQDDRCHDITGAHGRLEAFITVRQADVGKLVEHEAHGNGQRAAVYLVCLIVKLLKRLGVEHPDEEVQGYVVAVRDDAENGLLALAQLFQLQLVVRRDPLYLRQGKRGETHGGADEDAHRRLAGGLFENLVLPHGDMIRVFFLQRLKQKIQRGNMIAVALLRRAVLQHGQHHFHCLILRRGLMEKIEHERAVQRRLAFLPKGVVAVGVLRRGIADKVGD